MEISPWNSEQNLLTSFLSSKLLLAIGKQIQTAVTDVVVHTYNSSTQSSEEGGSGVQESWMLLQI